MGRADIVEGIDTSNGLDRCTTSHQRIVGFRNTDGAGILNIQLDIDVCL